MAVRQVVTKPAKRYHHEVVETNTWRRQATTTPANPAAKYLSHDLVTSNLMRTSSAPKVSIGAQVAKIEGIAAMTGPLSAGIRNSPAGPATNNVARNIIGL